MVDSVATDPGTSTVPVDVVAIPGSPAKVLVHQTRDADVLVLGHRGRGAVAGALLGSVGLACVLHATCPVTIVR
jgi:nucleotide-binding universal stress UspA family protein